MTDKLTIVLPTLNEAGNIGPLIASLRQAFGDALAEVLVIDGHSRDATQAEAAAAGARVIADDQGYARALQIGMTQAVTTFVMVLDADGSHRAEDALKLWAARENADLVIGSRLVPGGGSDGAAYRRALSSVLAGLFSLFARLPARDISSGFRLYRRELFTDMTLAARFFEVQPTLLAHGVSKGARVREVGIHYHQRSAGRSKNRIFKYGWAFLRCLWRLRREARRRDKTVKPA
ncbi:MAG: glycosyltransferase [Planctomycetes bacterium]|nr:glycosyltransferase [Planctomycetota bacterium]MCL4732033.1 glycosyltransferase [Planctomycetota bacterium]